MFNDTLLPLSLSLPPCQYLLKCFMIYLFMSIFLLLDFSSLKLGALHYSQFYSLNLGYSMEDGAVKTKCQVEEWINTASKLLASCFPASFSSKVSRIPCQMDFLGHSFHSIILLPMAQWFLWYIISGSNSFAWHSFADPAKCVHIPPV